MSSGTSPALRGSVHQEWWVVDATNKVLGRLATRVARDIPSTLAIVSNGI